MSDTPAAAGSRRAENLQIVAAIDPALAARLRDRQPMLTRPVVEAGCTIDIDLGESRLYGRSAADFAAAQVEAFLAAPTRLAAARPDAGKLMDPHSIALVERLEAAASDVALPGLPEVRGGILFVVGIGLGAHLEPLIASTAPRHVVLVEPIAEFLVHSLDAIDWRAVRARCADSGAALHIVAEETRETCLARLEAAMAGIGETAIDGSHLFVHYTTPAPREIAGHIHRFAGLLTILKGYFDDERLMVENMTANVGARDFRLLDGTRRDPVDVPAIVVGSGPSLDGSIEAIRRCRDHAVIVSAGSALQVLLHHGIVPDWHVEKENTAVSAARLRLILERNRARFPDGRFAGVRLVSSATVDPGVVDLFDDVCLFLRDALSSTAMFGAGHVPLGGTAPYSANAALSVAAHLGFRQVFLFGCDCGARRGAGHHSPNTVYYDDSASPDAETYRRETARSAGRFAFPLTAPGNFGGEAETNSYFLWSARAHAQAIAALGLTAYNCSDGVAIDGAGALPPDALAPADGAPLDRAVLAAWLDEQTRWYPAAGYLDGQDVAGAAAGWDAFADYFRTALATLDTPDAGAGAGDIHEFAQGVADCLDAAAARWPGPAVLAGGTLRAQPVLAAWWLDRATPAP